MDNSDKRMDIMLREASSMGDKRINRGVTPRPNPGQKKADAVEKNFTQATREFSPTSTQSTNKTGCNQNIITINIHGTTSRVSVPNSRDGSANRNLRPGSFRANVLPDHKKGDRNPIPPSTYSPPSDDAPLLGMDNDESNPGVCFFIILAILIMVLTFPFSICMCIKIIKEHERAVKFRMGKVVKGRALGPGMMFVFPCIDRYVIVDLRTVSFDVPPQEILTLDSVSVAVDAVVYFKIFNSKLSVIGVEDATLSTRKLAATTLRNVLGTKTLEQILLDRDDISNAMLLMLDEGTDPWGVHVERVELKDVRLPMQLQRVMAAEAEASREAKARVISATGEMHAAEALKMAADNLIQAPAAFELRFLQELNDISSERNHTIVVPLPVHVIKGLSKK